MFSNNYFNYKLSFTIKNIHNPFFIVKIKHIIALELLYYNFIQLKSNNTIKKNAIILFCLSLLSCDHTDPSSDLGSRENSSFQKSDPNELAQKSEIELKEIEFGKEFHKKDVLLKDSAGLNQIVLRYASPSKEILEDYLNTVTNELITITKVDQQSLVTTMADTTTKGSSNIISKDSNPQNIVFIEEVSRKFQNNVIGYKLNVKKEETSTSGRTLGNGFPYVAGYISSDWPEELHVKRLTPNNFSFFVKYKNGGLFASWYTPAFLQEMLPNIHTWPNPYIYATYFDTTPYVARVYNIDGPKKVEVIFDFHNYTDFTFWFYNDDL